jgi:aryl-alcohol dehydrogenase-like predicted oxidoreductase
MTIEKRLLGSSGIEVSCIGFGAGYIGSTNLTEQECGTLINRAIDLGMTLIDTAPGYGMSEERIGRHLAWRRKDFVLVTKCGYGVEGYQDWTPQIITAGAERALRTMNTDMIDVLLLHSCPLETLQREEIIRALEVVKHSGKVRAIGYSGENSALEYAVYAGVFDVIETSVNIFDQWSLERLLPTAHAKGLGVIAKRPLANAPWRYAQRPTGNYCEVYWERMMAMMHDVEVGEWKKNVDELALRFSAYAEGVSCAITGTSSVANVERNIACVGMGALPHEIVSALRSAYRKHDDYWIGQV